MIKHLFVIGLLSFITSLAISQSNMIPAEPTVASQTLSKIEFDEPTFVFGEIEDGERIKNVFTFTNTGKEPLIISNAKGSCGCTVPMWPKEPIMPGESADLLVEFNSKGKGKVGGVKQSKRVTITANTDPANTFLTIQGTVYKKEKAEKEIKEELEMLKNPDVDVAKVALFPNPTQKELNVDLSSFAGAAGSVEIYNGTGLKVKSQKVEDFGKVLNFDVQEFVAGVYTVSIKIDGMNRIAKRFVVDR